MKSGDGPARALEFGLRIKSPDAVTCSLSGRNDADLGRIAVLDRGRLVQAARPAEIFDRPKARFVAEFVGKVNILTGCVEGAGRLLLADGVTIVLIRGRWVSAIERSLDLFAAV